MTIKAKTKIFDIGGSKAIKIPASVRSDSTFPLQEDKELVAEIKGKEIIIRYLHNKEKLD